MHLYLTILLKNVYSLKFDGLKVLLKIGDSESFETEDLSLLQTYFL